jgi:hypothetical protein
MPDRFSRFIPPAFFKSAISFESFVKSAHGIRIGFIARIFHLLPADYAAAFAFVLGKNIRLSSYPSQNDIKKI